MNGLIKSRDVEDKQIGASTCSEFGEFCSCLISKSSLGSETMDSGTLSSSMGTLSATSARSLSISSEPFSQYEAFSMSFQLRGTLGNLDLILELMSVNISVVCSDKRLRSFASILLVVEKDRNRLSEQTTEMLTLINS